MTIDYKKTLNLPHTQFPMKANLPQAEPTILKRWSNLSLYERLRKKNRGKLNISFMMGHPMPMGIFIWGMRLIKF